MNMNRRDFLKAVGAGMAAASVGSWAVAGSGEATSSRPAEPPKRPNFLFILTDQQRYDAVGAFKPAVTTPALDRLCREGVAFDHSYVAQAVCTPSRASIMSGLYPHTHKLMLNLPGEDALSDPAFNLGVTWPRLLQKAGYHTGYIGKWHLGQKAGPGFDEWMGFNTGLRHWLGEAQQSKYRSDDETDKGLDFLERNKDKPFVLYQSYYPPHTPYNPPQKFQDAYRGKLEPPAYWGAVTAIDQCVGRLLRKLDELGLTENTVVIFTSDHGDHFGQRPGHPHKCAGYDDSARVPLIVRYPAQFKGGRVCTELVSNVDLMPTILGLAGVEAPNGLQGVSLKPLLAGQSPAWRKTVVIENKEDLVEGGGDKGDKAVSRTIRNDRFKLILRDKLPVRAAGLWELYDLKADPQEQKNIYGKDQAAVIGELLAALDAWCVQTQDTVGKELAAACRKNLSPNG
jgi:arylsulfatase A-like enzyme